MRAAELGDYLARRRPALPIADLATLDGYLAALVVGPKFIDPMRFMAEILGPDADLSLTAGTEELRVNQGVALEYNRVSETLSDRPRFYRPRFAKRADGSDDPTPWCDGFCRAIRPRKRSWANTLKPRRAEFAMLRPILLRASIPLAAGLLGRDSEPLDVLGVAAGDGSPSVEIAEAVIMLRGYWMPSRVRQSRAERR